MMYFEKLSLSTREKGAEKGTVLSRPAEIRLMNKAWLFIRIETHASVKRVKEDLHVVTTWILKIVSE